MGAHGDADYATRDGEDCLKSDRTEACDFLI
jgi:hypothetical protein